jgi:hypothetical protein
MDRQADSGVDATIRRVDVIVDVTVAAETGEPLRTAATVAFADAPHRVAHPLVACAFPGSGYTRRYFDLDIDDGPAYSQAADWAKRGHVFVCCDHLGVGDADVPTKPISIRSVARANAATARWVLEELRAGSLVENVPPMAPAAVVGLGQSYGGFLLTMQQVIDPVFDGVGFLGWSGVQTLPPWPSDVDREAVISGLAGNGLDHPMRRSFHVDDEPLELVRRDMTRPMGRRGPDEPWGAEHFPGGPAAFGPPALTPGVVAGEAARIAVPVLVACGAVDVVPDPTAEPAAYPASPEVTVAVFERMAHMHNFAPTRRLMWDAIFDWSEAVSGRRNATP